MFDYDVIPRSEATWESPGTAYKPETFYLEIATGLRPRNDRGNLKLVLLFKEGNRPALQWYVMFSQLKAATLCISFDQSSLPSQIPICRRMRSSRRLRNLAGEMTFRAGPKERTRISSSVSSSDS